MLPGTSEGGRGERLVRYRSRDTAGEARAWVARGDALAWRLRLTSPAGADARMRVRFETGAVW